MVEYKNCVCVEIPTLILRSSLRTRSVTTTVTVTIAAFTKRTRKKKKKEEEEEKDKQGTKRSTRSRQPERVKNQKQERSNRPRRKKEGRKNGWNPVEKDDGDGIVVKSRRRSYSGRSFGFLAGSRAGRACSE